MRFILQLTSLLLVFSCAYADQTDAERLLHARSAEFNQELIKVTEGVYTAIGFGVSPSTMIIGETGIVIVDTQVDAKAAGAALKAFRSITDKPVKAVVITHGHPDHTGGASLFIKDGEARGQDVEVWVRAGFGEEGRWLNQAGLTIQRLRGARQGGFLLKPDQRINNGVARAYWPERRGGVFGGRQLTPTHVFNGEREQISVAGLQLELVAANGETADQLYVWFPKRKVVLAGDNFYRSWPNLYAIRGTGYRDVRAWAQALDAMLKESPDYLIGGHTRPILGNEAVTSVLMNYRDAIQSIFDQTIAGMNKGLTPDDLVEQVRLPEHLASLDYLREYYGNIEWAVRSIFAGYLGWFDGNATTLFPLSPADEALRLEKLVGGRDALRTAASKALADDPQWTAQLCDHLLALDRQDREAMLLKADALEALARELLTATGRNYYNTSAMQLRMRAKGETSPP